MRPITREEARDMADAHADGLHTPPDGVPREGCPECEDRPLASYPPAATAQPGRAATHELIREAESLARELRVASRGEFSLAVVRNHGKTLSERQGMSWHEAHQATERKFGEPS